MSFGFLYKDYSKERGFFYNGDKTTLDKVFDQKQAIEWYNNNLKFTDKTGFTKIIYNNNGTLLNMNIPLYHPYFDEKKRVSAIGAGLEKDEGNEIKDRNKEFNFFINNNILNPEYKEMLFKFGETYIVEGDGKFRLKDPIKFHGTRTVDVLISMYLFIMGFIMVDDFVCEYINNKGKFNVLHQNNICYNYLKNLGTELEYNFYGNKNTLELVGQYGSNIGWILAGITKRGGGFFGFMQEWQKVITIFGGGNTHILGPRGIGKTFQILWFLFLNLFKERNTRYERDGSSRITSHFLGYKDSVNVSFLKKVNEYISKLFGDYPPHKIYKKENICTIPRVKVKINKDGSGTLSNDYRDLEFLSSKSSSPSRGLRVSNFAFDESDFVDNFKELNDILTGTAGTVGLYISTVNNFSKSDTYYNAWDNIYKDQLGMIATDTIIYYLWNKYKLYKLKNKKDVKEYIENGTSEKVRNEFLSLTGSKAFRFTIEDNELVSKEDKITQLKKIKDTKGDYKGEYYALKHFIGTGVFIDDENKYIEYNEYEKPFSHIFMFHDEAGEYDNPGLCIIGYSKINKSLHILDAINLPKELHKKKIELARHYNKYKKYCENNNCVFRFGADYTRSGYAIHEFLLNLKGIDGGEGIFAEYPIKFVSGDVFNGKLDNNLGIFMYHISKKISVEKASEVYKNKNFTIDYKLGGKDTESFRTEMGNFVYENGKYKGVGKTHDDRVMSFIGCIAMFQLENILSDFLEDDDTKTEYISDTQDNFLHRL